MEVVGINIKGDGFLKKAVKSGRSKLDCILSFCNYLKILIGMENGISC